MGVPLGDVGEQTYQIDRSAHPARKAARGAPPASARRDFLVQLLQAFRSSACVLVLHGKTVQTGDDWEMCNRALTETFVGETHLDESEGTAGRQGLDPVVDSRWSHRDAHLGSQWSRSSPQWGEQRICKRPGRVGHYRNASAIHPERSSCVLHSYGYYARLERVTSYASGGMG